MPSVRLVAEALASAIGLYSELVPGNMAVVTEVDGPFTVVCTFTSDGEDSLVVTLWVTVWVPEGPLVYPVVYCHVTSAASGDCHEIVVARVVVINVCSFTVYSYGGEIIEGVADEVHCYVTIKTSHSYPASNVAYCWWATWSGEYLDWAPDAGVIGAENVPCIFSPI